MKFRAYKLKEISAQSGIYYNKVCAMAKKGELVEIVYGSGNLEGRKKEHSRFLSVEDSKKILNRRENKKEETDQK